MTTQHFFAPLFAFSDAVQEVAYLTGNSGRKVRRMLERYFHEDVCTFELQFPQTISRLAFADRVFFVSKACQLANTAVQEFNLATKAHYGFEVSDLEARRVRLVVRATAPESMSGRQQFLSDIAFGLSRVTAMLLFHQDAPVDDAYHERCLFEELFADNPDANTPERRATVRAQFEALVEGDFASLAETPLSIIGLAALLNAAVEVESRRLDELYQREIDEALALLDIEKAA